MKHLIALAALGIVIVSVFLLTGCAAPGTPPVFDKPEPTSSVPDLLKPLPDYTSKLEVARMDAEARDIAFTDDETWEATKQLAQRFCFYVRLDLSSAESQAVTTASQHGADPFQTEIIWDVAFMVYCPELRGAHERG